MTSSSWLVALWWTLLHHGTRLGNWFSHIDQPVTAVWLSFFFVCDQNFSLNFFLVSWSCSFEEITVREMAYSRKNVTNFSVDLDIDIDFICLSSFPYSFFPISRTPFVSIDWSHNSNISEFWSTSASYNINQ